MGELTKQDIQVIQRSGLAAGDLEALCRDWLEMAEEIERLKQGRCLVTGNPCGTDTRAMGDPCPCFACADYTADVEVQGIVAMYESDIARLQHELAEERARLDFIDAAGEQGEIHIGVDCGDSILIKWSEFGFAGIPTSVRAAIDAAERSRR